MQLLDTLDVKDLVNFIWLLGENSRVPGFRLMPAQRARLAEAAATKLDSVSPSKLTFIMLGFSELGWSAPITKEQLWQRVCVSASTIIHHRVISTTC